MNLAVTTREEFVADIAARIKDATGYTPVITRQTLDYAGIVFDRAKDLYERVITGRI